MHARPSRGQDAPSLRPGDRVFKTGPPYSTSYLKAKIG